MYPYQNPDLSTEERISDLMSRMTLEEKILQTDQYYSGDFTTQDENGKVTAVDMQRFDALMQHNSVGSVQLRGMTAAQANVVQRYAIENTRLGIPYLFSEEALHGLMTNNATSFPQQIGLAASFEPELGREMGHAIAAESRACGIHETYSPVMDLIRDPRYGRAEESFGYAGDRPDDTGHRGCRTQALRRLRQPCGGTELRPLHHGSARCIQRLSACL